MTDNADGYCVTALRQEIGRYQVVVGVSLSLTFLSIILIAVYREQMVARPCFASRLYYGLSAFKILLGILLLTAFSPTCPAGCSCGVYHPSYMYPIVVLFLGLVWAKRAKKFADMYVDDEAQQQQSAELVQDRPSPEHEGLNEQQDTTVGEPIKVDIQAKEKEIV